MDSAGGVLDHRGREALVDRLRTAGVITFEMSSVGNAAGDEDTFVAVVGERLAGEADVQRVQFEGRNVDEPEPLVLRRPLQRIGRAVVADDIDAVVAHRVLGAARRGMGSRSPRRVPPT
jgi:hypothetical protein